MQGHVKHQETIDYFLKIVWQTVANRYNQLVTEFGITQSIGYLLINIDEKEGTTVSQAAALLGLKSTSLSRMLRQLEKSGLIYRESNEGDKRSVKIYLTPLGKEKRQMARAIVKQFNNYLNAHISEADKEYLIKTLKKINQLTLNFKPEDHKSLL
ncbi:MAG: MarR family transcriptional regulator [Mucilaginibacter sp.]|jgi:DNA-binding MarR family transcriptional regulator|nr:MarR family transcriptional regulator [Mucilaginibacter sp.]MDB5139761.1 MarR family transcriptional regulator [Mucilaginibacter sp.]